MKPKSKFITLREEELRELLLRNELSICRCVFLRYSDSVMMDGMNFVEERNGYSWYSKDPRFFPNDYRNQEGIFCPYGRSADVLFVKESWSPRVFGNEDEISNERKKRYCIYKYDSKGQKNYLSDQYYEYKRWQPASSMPKWASRFFVSIVSVSPKRLFCVENSIYSKQLWHKIYKKTSSFDSNPWVWDIKIKRINKKNQEQE